tara:strand:- start:5082 stop:8615 length:3534 start_codon:yes stop_codon:yes gene_type:complete
MAVSLGPYSTCLFAPVVTIQAISSDIGYSAGVPRRMHIRMEISNEKALGNQRVGNFKNFVMVSPDIEMLNRLCYDKDYLVRFIKGAPSRRPWSPGKIYRSSASFKTTISKSLPQKEWKEKAPLGTRPGQTTWNWTYDAEFVINYNPNVYVLVVSYAEYKGSIDVKKMSMLQDTILQNGLVPPRTQLFRLAETMEGFGVRGSLWPTAVHMYLGNNKIMAGPVHTIAKHPMVTAQNVTNFKNIDLRILDASNRLRLDFLPPVSLRDAVSAYVSEPTLSRNGDGLIHGFFSFDLFEYARDNTEFGRFLRVGESLSSTCRIKDIVVYSKLAGQTMKGNSLTPGNQGESPCGTGKTDQYKKVASLGDNLDIISTSNDGEVLNIAFMDRSAINHTEGHMQYRIEVLVIDETRNALQGILEKLNTTLKQCEGLPREKEHKGPWNKLVSQYMAALMFIFGKEEILGFTVPYWKRNLLALTSKFNQSLVGGDGYGLLVQHIRNVVGQIADLLVSKTGPKTNRSGAKKSRVRAVKRSPYLMMEKEFKTKFQIQGNRNVGLDYLDSKLTNTFGVMPTLAYGVMVDRVEEEKQKYSVSNPNAVGINAFGFLSPAAVSLSNNFARVPTTCIEASTDSLSSLQRNKTNTNTSVMNPQKSLSSEKNKMTILNSIGVVATPYPISLGKLVAAKGLTKSKEADSRHMLSNDSKFTEANTSKTAQTGSIQSNIKGIFTSATLANSPLVNTIVNKQAAGFKEVRPQNLGSIAGSLAGAKLQDNEEITTQINSLSNVINFGSLVRVEYLEGFDHLYGISAPNWVPMTEEAHKAAEANEDTLVCRLVQITNTVNVRGDLGLRPLATLFALGPIREGYSGGGDYNRKLKESEYDVRGMVPGSNLLEQQGPLSLYAVKAPLYPMPEEVLPPPSKGKTRFSKADKQRKIKEACKDQEKHMNSVNDQIRTLSRRIDALEPPPRYWSEVPLKQRPNAKVSGPIPYSMYKASLDELEDLQIERANLIADLEWLQKEYKDCLIREERARKAAAAAAAKAEALRILRERKEKARQEAERKAEAERKERARQEEARQRRLAAKRERDRIAAQQKEEARVKEEAAAQEAEDLARQQQRDRDNKQKQNDKNKQNQLGQQQRQQKYQEKQDNSWQNQSLKDQKSGGSSNKQSNKQSYGSSNKKNKKSRKF